MKHRLWKCHTHTFEWNITKNRIQCSSTIASTCKHSFGMLRHICTCISIDLTHLFLEIKHTKDFQARILMINKSSSPELLKTIRVDKIHCIKRTFNQKCEMFIKNAQNKWQYFHDKWSNMLSYSFTEVWGKPIVKFLAFLIHKCWI